MRSTQSYRGRTRGETYREPDITVYLAEHLDRFGERYGEFPDLVIEVVSADSSSQARDYEDKRRDYAAAGVPEYCFIDPFGQRVNVLVLAGDAYRVQGEYVPGRSTKSKLLDGFSVEVDAVLRAATPSG